MPTFITTAHQKGGVGKSTIALNLYGYFARAGVKTAIVDIDPQGTISQFEELLEPGRLNIIRRGDFTSFADLQAKAQGFEVVIVDTPPYLTDELQKVFKITNILIIPCKPTVFDALAIRQTIAFIEESKRQLDDDFLPLILFTMVKPRAKSSKSVRETLKQHNIKILETEIGNRVAYEQSLLLTGSVVDDDSGKAKEEIENLASEILSLIKK